MFGAYHENNKAKHDFYARQHNATYARCIS
jgi:hypothetical protein